MRILLVLALLLALGACADDSKAGAGPGPSKAAPSKGAPSKGPAPSPGTTGQDASHTKACAEVRAGIDAFNLSDFEGTVGHFELALPLARADASAHPSAAADDLVEAIRYYAELAPADYPKSARSSTAFLRYKTITLGQCVSPDRQLQDSTQPPSTTT